MQRRTKYLIFLLQKKREESSGSGWETPRPPLPRPLASPSQPRRAPLTKRRCPNSRPFSHPLMLDSPWRPRAGSSPSSGRCQPSSFSPVTLRCTARQHFALQPPRIIFPRWKMPLDPPIFSLTHRPAERPIPTNNLLNLAEWPPPRIHGRGERDRQQARCGHRTDTHTRTPHTQAGTRRHTRAGADRQLLTPLAWR